MTERLTDELRARIRTYLYNGRKQFIERPAEDAVQRIVSYRTCVCLAYNEAYEAEETRDVLVYLHEEHEWACGVMRANGITPPGEQQ